MDNSNKPNILVTRLLPDEGMARLRSWANIDIWEEDVPMPRSELMDRIVGKDGILCLLSDRIDEEVMERCPGLKVIGNYAVGYDNIEVDQATKRGIPVLNTPGVLTDATADLAFSLLLSSARRVAECDRYIRDGKFVSWGPKLMLGLDVHGATLGVIGAGKIGEAVLRRGKGFNMRLVYNSRSRKPDLEKEIGAEYMAIDDLLKISDFISLNCPLTDQTRHMIGEREFSIMKDTAVLINTARGPVVDEEALYNALSEKKIGAAGLDVFEEEPKIFPSLMDLDNVTMVPHIGSSTVTTRKKMAYLVIDGMARSLSGERPDNLVNPEVFDVQEG